MLLRVILKNFLSFEDEVQFDMFPNMRKESLPNHVTMAADSLPILKMAAIYVERCKLYQVISDR